MQCDTILAVQLGIGIGPVVGEHDCRHIGQINGIYPLHPHIKEQKLLHLGKFRDFFTHGNHIADAVLFHITRRHGKILGSQDIGNHIHGQDLVQVRPLQGLLTGILHLLQTPFQLGQCTGQRSGIGIDLGSGIAQFQQALGFLPAQKLGCIFHLQHTAVHFLQSVLQGFDALIDLDDAILHLVDLVIHGLGIHAFATELFGQFADLSLDLFQCGLLFLNGSTDAFQIQTLSSQFCLQLCPGGL